MDVELVVSPRLFMTNERNLFWGKIQINNGFIDYGYIYDMDDFYKRLCELRNLAEWLEIKKKEKCNTYNLIKWLKNKRTQKMENCNCSNIMDIFIC